MSYLSYPSDGPIAPIPRRGRSPQPYMQTMQTPPPMGMPASAGIQPGATTYTTSMGPDGRPVYHMFRAEPASYRTAQGLIHGTQWVPVDPVSDEPLDAAPASVDWIQQWAQNRKDSRDEKLYREWIRNEEKRRRHEEKEYVKQRDYDREVRRPRSRAGSFSAPIQPSYPEAPVTSGNYLAAAAPEPMPLTRQRQLSPGRDVSDYMRGMDLNDDSSRRQQRRKSFSYAEDSDDYYDRNKGSVPLDQRSNAGYGYTPRGNYNRASADDYSYKNQLMAEPAGTYPSGHIMSYSGTRGQSISDRPKSPFSGVPIIPQVPEPQILDRPRSPYRAGSQLTDRPRSPYQSAGQLTDRPRSPYGDRPRTPNYSYSGVSGTGYVDEPGQRYSPNSVINPPPSQMSVQEHRVMFPEAFNRMPSFPDVLASFDPFLVTWLDSLAQEMPRLPAVLVGHDITHQDWIRFMSDLTSVWVGEYRNSYAYSGSRQPRKSTMAASLIDSWNSAYFLTRRVEVILVKGKTRFSGPRAGKSELRLLRAIEETLDENFDDSEIDELSDLEDYDDPDSDRSSSRYSASGNTIGYNNSFGFYGSGPRYRMPGDDTWMSEASFARKKWVQRIKEERRHQQKKERARLERTIKKRYSLYVQSTS